MDVREDGDAHRQSLAAISAAGRAARREARRPRPARRRVTTAGGSGGRLARARRAGRAALRRDDEPVVRPSRATAAADDAGTPAAAEAPSTARRPAAELVVVAVAASRRRAIRRRASSGNASSTSSASGADGPGDDGRPALALARLRGEVLGADRARPDRRRGRSRPRPSRGTTPSCAIDSTSSARSAGSAAASGSPGKPPPLPRSTNAPDAEPAKLGHARRGCRRRAAGRDLEPGRGSAVRLIAAFQARRSRTWPSIAARAPGVSVEPDRREARRRGRPRTPAGGREGPERASGADHADGPGTPPVGRACAGRPGSAPGVVSSHRWSVVGLPGPVRFAAGFPRAPRQSRYPRGLSADAGR